MHLTFMLYAVACSLSLFSQIPRNCLMKPFMKTGNQHGTNFSRRRWCHNALRNVLEMNRCIKEEARTARFWIGASLSERSVHHLQTQERELGTDSSHSLQSSFSYKIYTRYRKMLSYDQTKDPAEECSIAAGQSRVYWHRRAGFTVRVRGTRSKCGLQW